MGSVKTSLHTGQIIVDSGGIRCRTQATWGEFQTEVHNRADLDSDKTQGNMFEARLNERRLRLQSLNSLQLSRDLVFMGKARFL